jgi:hypothetical protein
MRHCHSSQIGIAIKSSPDLPIDGRRLELSQKFKTAIHSSQHPPSSAIAGSRRSRTFDELPDSPGTWALLRRLSSKLGCMLHFQNDWQWPSGFKLPNHFQVGFGSECVTFLGLVLITNWCLCWYISAENRMSREN